MIAVEIPHPIREMYRAMLTYDARVIEEERKYHGCGNSLINYTVVFKAFSCFWVAKVTFSDMCGGILDWSLISKRDVVRYLE